jgi:hypothetical protein
LRIAGSVLGSLLLAVALFADFGPRSFDGGLFQNGLLLLAIGLLGVVHGPSLRSSSGGRKILAALWLLTLTTGGVLIALAEWQLPANRLREEQKILAMRQYLEHEGPDNGGFSHVGPPTPPARPPGLRVCSNEGGSFRKECPPAEVCLDGFAMQLRKDRLGIPFGCYALCNDLHCPGGTRCRPVAVRQLVLDGGTVSEVQVCLPIEPPDAGPTKPEGDGVDTAAPK